MPPAIERVMKRDDENGIDERSFRFFCNVVTFADTITPGPKTNRIIEQLIGAAGSIGANREEALGGTRAEFRHYNEVALRSANESVRWLRACAVSRLGNQALCTPLLNEARQLAKILAAIVITIKRNDGADKKPEA